MSLPDLKTFLTENLVNLTKGLSDLAHTWITTNKDKVVDEQAQKDFDFKVQQFTADQQQKMIDAANAAQAEEDANITDRWKGDMTSDSKLSKNVRPLTLIYLLVFVTILAVLDSITKLNFHVADQWVNLFQYLLGIVFVAYFGSRGLEKMLSIFKNGNGKTPTGPNNS